MHTSKKQLLCATDHFTRIYRNEIADCTPTKKLRKFRESPAGDPALPAGKHNHVFLDANDIPVMS